MIETLSLNLLLLHHHFVILFKTNEWKCHILKAHSAHKCKMNEREMIQTLWMDDDRLEISFCSHLLSSLIQIGQEINKFFYAFTSTHTENSFIWRIFITKEWYWNWGIKNAIRKRMKNHLWLIDVEIFDDTMRMNRVTHTHIGVLILHWNFAWTFFEAKNYKV